MGLAGIRRVWYTDPMLYVFCGNRFSARERAREFVHACRKKREQAEYIHLSPDVSQQSPEELLLGQGLFENKYIVFCDELISDAVSDHLMNNITAYRESPHVFIVFEPSLSPAQEKHFAKCDVSVQRFADQEKREDTRSLFAFTDVFMKHDRVKTFTALHRALLRGESPTSLLNILLWQLRMLALVSGAQNATEAGVKPFVYTKTKGAISAFGNPFDVFLDAERIVRQGRLRGETDEEIIEHIVLVV